MQTERPRAWFASGMLLLLPFVGVPSQADDAASAYARSCLAQQTLQRPEPFVRVRRFGDNEATATVILDLIRRGEKSVTFSTPALYAGQRAKTPVVGDVVVITDFAGRPGAVVRTTSVRIVPFNEVTEDDSRYEGPTVRPLAAWRRIHWAYFTRELVPLGQQPSEALPVTVERFELLCAGPTGNWPPASR